MKVNKVSSSFASTLKKFNKGEENTQTNSHQFEQRGENEENLIPDVNMTQVHLREVENITKHLEEVMNTQLIFHCVWLENEKVHNIYFLDADTNEILLRMNISSFKKMVDNFIFAREEGQVMPSKGNFISIHV